ncbi:Hypothetical_protein [Hexamita inflata]|uniref:Hypothetical_protein n=1 Tax=Hexamita inflata TaxID=28002 RepID=A0AA86TEX5_9EUKA|nr:Hypothetical protein HINF_LOCUS1967 [Hexamita inflata]
MNNDIQKVHKNIYGSGNRTDIKELSGYNNEIQLNPDFINAQEYDTFNLHYNGVKGSVFSLSNVSMLLKQIRKLSLKNISVNLEGLSFKTELIELTDCEVLGTPINFCCDYLVVKITGNFDILWICRHYFSTLSLFASQLFRFGSQLTHLSNLSGIQQLTLTNSEINLQFLNLTLNELIIEKCSLFNKINNLNVHSLTIKCSSFASSQLSNTQITELSIYQSADEYFDIFRGEQLINELPNAQIVNLFECTFKPRTNSSPKIKNLNIFGSKINWRNSTELVSFSFFKNVESIQIENEPESLKEYLKWRGKYIKQKKIDEEQIVINQALRVKLIQNIEQLKIMCENIVRIQIQVGRE